MGHTLVLASSALRYQTAPWAQELGMDHVLQTEVELAGGVLTGRVLGPPMYGAQKARGLEALAAEHDLDLDASFAYSNGGEDVPFLSATGHATAIEPDERLAAEARERGWPVLRCRARGGRPGPLDLARTGAFYGTFFSTLGVGVGVGLLNRSRRSLLDVALGVGSELSLAVAGVQVDVVSGAEHLVGTRPAVFVFNHTSKMDAFVAMKLVRGEVTGVAKAEAKRVPVFGQLFQIAGMAFLDRKDPARAVEALAPVVEKLRSGTSIIVSPEGTRTPTPRLGPFKKGPFHIAMQAGVPIVPMLFRGVDEVQWRGAQVVRPGRVEVVVLPPVDTSDWAAATVAEHRDHVRGLMLDALDAWPGARRPQLLAQEAGA
jgi:putative phosphoserine phosphatase/1-acylglycerol-3-phosphate O-acyltransferase